MYTPNSPSQNFTMNLNLQYSGNIYLAPKTPEENQLL